MSLADLPFPKSLPEFQKLFKSDANCDRRSAGNRNRADDMKPHLTIVKSEPDRPLPLPLSTVRPVDTLLWLLGIAAAIVAAWLLK